MIRVLLAGDQALVRGPSRAAGCAAGHRGGRRGRDYIGMVAAGRRLVVAYIQPSADPSELNRVLVSSF